MAPLSLVALMLLAPQAPLGAAGAVQLEGTPPGAAPLEAQLVPGVLQGQPVPQIPLWLDPERQTAVANCVVDIGLATTQLGQAGLGINAAVTRCGTQIDANGKPVLKETGEVKQACAATALGITASFQYAAFFMSTAALDCGKTFALVDDRATNKLQCAADVQLLLTSLTIIASAGTAVGDACKSPAPAPALPPRRLKEELHVPAHLQHLAAQNATSLRRALATPTPLTGTARSAEITECVFDVAQVMLFFSRAGLLINAAVQDCTAVSLYQGRDKNRLKCAADIGRLIGAFAFAGAGIAASIAHCPEWKRGTEPICAASVLSLIAATAKVQASSASMAIDCTPEMAGTRRRLDSNASASVLDAKFV